MKVKVHQLYNVRYEVRFHFDKDFESDTERLAETVRLIDEIDPWNIDEVDQIECLPDIFPYSYADVGEVIERRVIVTPQDSPMPLGRMRGYRNHVDEVEKNFTAWKDQIIPEALVIRIAMQF